MRPSHGCGYFLATRALFETGFFDQVEVRAEGAVLLSK